MDMISARGRDLRSIEDVQVKSTGPVTCRITCITTGARTPPANEPRNHLPCSRSSLWIAKHRDLSGSQESRLLSERTTDRENGRRSRATPA